VKSLLQARLFYLLLLVCLIASLLGKAHGPGGGFFDGPK
jgi:hypothetical protein